MGIDKLRENYGTNGTEVKGSKMMTSKRSSGALLLSLLPSGMVQQDYHSQNPYHNAVHAADVTQAMYCYLKEPKVTSHTPSFCPCTCSTRLLDMFPSVCPPVG